MLRVWLFACVVHSTTAEDTARLHVATFASELAISMSTLLATSSKYTGSVSVLGAGRQTHWGKGLQTKVDSYHVFLDSFSEFQLSDIVLFADAYDTMLVAQATQIVDAVVTLESHTKKLIFFGAEPACSGLCDQQDTIAINSSVTTPWKYLNSGLIAGRVAALKGMFNNMRKLSDCSFCTGDQELFAEYFVENPSIATLDYSCTLFQNIYHVDGVRTSAFALGADHNAAITLQPVASLQLSSAMPARASNPVIDNVLTGSRPLVLHFPGAGKWGYTAPCLADTRRLCSTSVLYEVFRILHPDEYQGSQLKDMQDRVDDLAHSDFLRRIDGSYLSPMGGVAELISKLKDRDLKICLLGYLAIAFGIALLCAVSCFIFRPSKCDTVRYFKLRIKAEEDVV